MLSAVSLSVWTHMRALVRAPWEVWQVSFHQQPRAMWLTTCLFISSSLSQEFCLATELDTVEVSQGQGSSKNDSHPAPRSLLGTGCSTMNTVIFHARLPGCEAQSLKYWSMQKTWRSPQRGCLTFRGKKRSFYSLILSSVVLIRSWLHSANVLFQACPKEGNHYDFFTNNDCERLQTHIVLIIQFINCNTRAKLIKILTCLPCFGVSCLKKKNYRYSIPTLNSIPFLPPQCQTVS